MTKSLKHFQNTLLGMALILNLSALCPASSLLSPLLIHSPGPAICKMPPPQKIALYSTIPFTGNVRNGTGDVLVDNAPYSKVYHVTVTTPQNEPLYDLATLAEPAGAIALAVRKSGEIALIRQYRPVPANDPADHSAFDSPEPSRHGFFSMEVPRGFPEEGESFLNAAAREIREEVGVDVTKCVLLGWLNFNTALVMTDLPVVLCLVGEEIGSERERAEVIEDVIWVEFDQLAEMVCSGKIRCGLTLSAVAYLLAARGKVKIFLERGGD